MKDKGLEIIWLILKFKLITLLHNNESWTYKRNDCYKSRHGASFKNSCYFSKCAAYSDYNHLSTTSFTFLTNIGCYDSMDLK